MKTSDAKVYFKPDWHPKLHKLLGDIRGEMGYVTAHGTIRLLGTNIFSPEEISESSYETEDRGPTLLFSAKSGGF